MLSYCCFASEVCHLSQIEVSSFSASSLDDFLCVELIQMHSVALTLGLFWIEQFTFPLWVYPSSLTECNISSVIFLYKIGQLSPGTLSHGLRFVLWPEQVWLFYLVRLAYFSVCILNDSSIGEQLFL